MSWSSQQVRGRIIKQLRKGDSGANSYDNSNGKGMKYMYSMLAVQEKEQ